MGAQRYFGGSGRLGIGPLVTIGAGYVPFRSIERIDLLPGETNTLTAVVVLSLDTAAEQPQMPADYASLIRTIPNFPQPGIMFRDITPLLQDGPAYRKVVQDMCQPFRSQSIDQVVAIEARGYLLGAPMAIELGAGFVPVRKFGKLPFSTLRAEYELEYGEAVIEMHRDGLLDYHNVLIVDDVLATGGTLAATVDLVKQTGANVVGMAVLIELDALEGRARLQGSPLFSLMHM